MALLLLIVAFGQILGGAFLFTNAVEWLGHRLQLGRGAVGSVISAIPVAVGLAFTRWELDALALFAGATALAGGGVAVWTLHVRRQLTTPAMLAWAALFVACTTFVILG